MINKGVITMGKKEDKIYLYSAMSKSIIVIFCSLIVYTFIALCVTQFYHPDVEGAILESKELLVGNSNPEPMESLLFQMGIVIVPLLMLLFFWILNLPKLSQIKWDKLFKPLSIIFLLSLIITVVIGFLSNNPNFIESAEGVRPENTRDLLSPSNFNFYFAESILSQNIIVYILIFAFFIVLPTIIFKFHPKVFENKMANWLGLVILCFYVCFYLFQVYQIFQFDFPYTWQNQYDFNVVYYPMTQVYAGSPMLVDGFAANYGLYAHFLNPIFKTTGLSVASFTTVMSLLIVVSFAMIFISMLRTIKIKFVVFLGFASMLYMTLLLHRIATPFDALFAIFPIRQLIPAITLCIASFYFYNKKKKVFYITSFILLPLSVLWNPEFGLVCLFAWTITLCYTEFKSTDKKTIVKGCLKHIFIAITSLVLVFSTYSLVIYLTYGELPQLIRLFDSILYFGSLGFMMLPMTLVHPWNFVILIYVIGLAYAIHALFNKSKMNKKTSFILLLSIMGIGMFFYFQGRSHNWTLLFIIINTFFLLSIFADLLFEKIKEKSVPLSFYVGLFSILFILGFSACDLYKHSDKLVELQEQMEDKKKTIEEQKTIKNNIDFINSQLPKTTEKIFIHTSNKYQSLYFAPTKKQSAFNPGIIDIFTYENCNRLKNKILLDSHDVFIETFTFYYSYLRETNAAMTATYSVDTSNQSIAYMKKRQYKTLSTSILEENSDKILFYEKFSDDTASLNKRISYATIGTTPISWDENFSVEVIFYSEKQAYPVGTIFSNCKDSTGGFLLVNKRQTDDYAINWNNSYEINFKLSQNQWNYLIVQFANNSARVFLNGALVFNNTIPQAPKLSTSNLFIANSVGDQLNFFTGAISEILFKNGHSSEIEIQKRNKQFQEAKDGNLAKQ